MLHFETAVHAEEPTIVKYVEKTHTGIETINLSRHAIAYIVRGRQYIYDGDRRRVVNRGELLYLGVGRHYVESIPENGQPFEQIFIYFTPRELQRVLMHLNVTYQLTITNKHSCENCQAGSFVVAEAGSAIRNFFLNTNSYLRETLTCTHDEGCIRSRLLASVDMAREGFEQIIYEHLFKPVSIEDLAEKTNRSLTSFKKEFRRHFNAPPHKWFVKQRLTHSRLLLISTNMSISEIGNECSFPNTSHYIKLFKRAYHVTPAAYRNNHLGQNEATSTPDEAENYIELVS